MWQDILVSFVALGAGAILGRRWVKSRHAKPGCASCEAGNPCDDK
jgi:hypothetical protein